MSRSNQPSSTTLGKKTAPGARKKPISSKKQGVDGTFPRKKSVVNRGKVAAGGTVVALPAVQHRQVTEDEAGQRLDNYLLRHLKGVPKSRIYRIVRSGEVRVNGGRCQPDQRLNTGDELRLPPVRQEAFVDARPPVAPEIDLPVLYEDDGLLAINKPCGIAVHGGSGLAWGAIEALRAQRPTARFLELAHRLDRETSGVLLIAKRRPALVGLHDMFRSQKGDKRYLALVAGEWVQEKPGATLKVTAPLFKYLTPEGERRVRVARGRDLTHPETRPAETHFRLKTQYPGFALVEAQLKTGRTHQIRVHLASLGHPIVGDDKYGDFALNKSLSASGALDRMFLHAASLRCKHPVSGESLHIEAPLPEELQQFLDRCAAK
ncbi:MAG: RluA family pseudouridine synthase [Rhodocyclaceae bacterium]|nr:RluA family pseudouridine synthase [Rhodocyclaceae bacterium]